MTPKIEFILILFIGIAVFSLLLSIIISWQLAEVTDAWKYLWSKEPIILFCFLISTLYFLFLLDISPVNINQNVQSTILISVASGLTVSLLYGYTVYEARIVEFGLVGGVIITTSYTILTGIVAYYNSQISILVHFSLAVLIFSKATFYKPVVVTYTGGIEGNEDFNDEISIQILEKPLSETPSLSIMINHPISENKEDNKKQIEEVLSKFGDPTLVEEETIYKDGKMLEKLEYEIVNPGL